MTITTDGDAAVSAVVDHLNGTYTATITASTTPGDETITATDGTSSAIAQLHERLVCTTCFEDTTVSDFAAGASSSTYVAQIDNGEVTLQPTVATEFSGTTLPAGWTTSPYGGGSPLTSVADGRLTVNDAAVGTPVSAPLTAGTSVEFVATFSTNNPYQSVLLHSDPNFNSPPWAGFFLGSGGTQLQTTIGTSGGRHEVPLPLISLGVPHLFQIDWQAAAVTFFVDGQQVNQEAFAISSSMRFYAGDYTQGSGNPLTVDWIHISPFSTAGTFTSRVFDSGGDASWHVASWSADSPVGTTVTLAVRTGNTNPPDVTWGAFTPMVNGGSVGSSSRFIQYQATLGTSDQAVTPVLRDVSIDYDVTDASRRS